MTLYNQYQQLCAKQGRGQPDGDKRPWLVVLARVEPVGGIDEVDIDVMVMDSKPEGERQCRLWCYDRTDTSRVAWCAPLSPIDVVETGEAVKYGSGICWARYPNAFRLPGDVLAVNVGWRLVESALDGKEWDQSKRWPPYLKLLRADAAAALLNMCSPVDGEVSPAELGKTEPPKELPVWRALGECKTDVMTETAAAVTTLADAQRTMGYEDTEYDPQRGQGVLVFVLDTGCYTRHGAFNGKEIRTYDATGQGAADVDRNGHGTACVGYIVGTYNPSAQFNYVGQAPGARMGVVKVLTDAGWGTDTMIARGIDIAVNAGADVISMSLGGPGEMPMTAKAIQGAIGRGIIVVAAAGNDGPADGTTGYPCLYPGVVGVGAYDHRGTPTLASFSSRGAGVDMVAPGVQLIAPATHGAWWSPSGTSMACPMSAGCIAAFLSDYYRMPEGARPTLVEAITILGTTQKLYPGWTQGKRWYGDGVLQYSAARRELLSFNPPPPPPPPPLPVPGINRVIRADDTPDEVTDGIWTVIGVAHNILLGKGSVTLSARETIDGDTIDADEAA